MIRVLIAEDMHMIRGALVALLSLERDIDVVAELDRGDTIVEAALRTHPDVAVVDIDLPGLDGLAAAELLHEQLPECRTLVLTGLSQPGNLLRALKAHVRGFLLKDAPAETWQDVAVPESLSLAALARAAGSTEAELKRLNPQLRRGRTPPGETPYVVRVPANFTVPLSVPPSATVTTS